MKSTANKVIHITSVNTENTSFNKIRFTCNKPTQVDKINFK